ncbi:MAG: addiction module protein [Planctomycetes bacterium]|nr:addiction module protein [Planctomycetota bacterium]
MTRKQKEAVFDGALKLLPEERAALAGALIESLDESVDADAEAAWGREIAKRAKDLDSGKALGVPWSEARRRILKTNGRDSS